MHFQLFSNVTYCKNSTEKMKTKVEFFLFFFLLCVCVCTLGTAEGNATEDQVIRSSSRLPAQYRSLSQQ